jgi:hypothetical protein
MVKSHVEISRLGGVVEVACDNDLLLQFFGGNGSSRLWSSSVGNRQNMCSGLAQQSRGLRLGFCELNVGLQL